MRVKVELLKDEGSDAKDQTLNVESHHRRGDTFNVNRADTLMGGESQTFTIPNGGRLVINTPFSTEQPVYDRDQAAAVYASQQSQGREVGDRPNPDDVVKAREADLARAKEAADRQREMDERQRAAAEKASTTPPQGTAKPGNQTSTGSGVSAPVHSASAPNAGAKTPNPSSGPQPTNPATAQTHTEKK